MAQPDPDKDSQYVKRLKTILTFFYIFGGLSLLIVTIYGLTTKSLATCVIWALACMICGASVGFLFGIPKIVQGGKSANGDADSQEYQLHVNTNLTEISDWLTKIIVGLGLVKLTKLPPYLGSLAASMSSGIGGTDRSTPLTFAYATISCFSVLGFLFGYLFTRLYLSKTMSIADQDSVQQLKGQLEIQLASIESKQGLLTKSLFQTPNNTIHAAVENIAPANPAQDMAGLVIMANEYLNIRIKDWAERTRAKDALADRMGLYVFSHHIVSGTLFEYINDNPPANEGLVLALATLINNNPQKGDADLLLTAGEDLRLKHVRYRVLLAIVTLVKNGYIDKKNKPRAIKLVQSYKENADASLMHQIESTLSFLNS